MLIIKTIKCKKCKAIIILIRITAVLFLEAVTKHVEHFYISGS